jgi:hypothetical protein
MNGKAMKNSIGILCIWGLLWAVCPGLAQEPQEQTRSAASGRKYPPENIRPDRCILSFPRLVNTRVTLFVE